MLNYNSTGKVHGVFTATEDTTARYISERRLSTLRELAADLSEAEGMSQVCEATLSSLSRNAHDLPLVAIYLSEQQGKTLRRIDQTIPSNEITSLFPIEVVVASIASSDTLCASLLQVIHTNQMVLYDLQPNQKSAIGPLPPWDDQLVQIAYLPIGASKIRSSTTLAIHIIVLFVSIELLA